MTLNSLPLPRLMGFLSMDGEADGVPRSSVASGDDAAMTCQRWQLLSCARPQVTRSLGFFPAASCFLSPTQQNFIFSLVTARLQFLDMLFLIYIYFWLRRVVSLMDNSVSLPQTML